MSNLQSLTEILDLIRLAPESIDKILEHDRWKTEAILENNLQIEELRCKSLNGGDDTQDTSPHHKEDIEFNTISSLSECNQSQIFRIAKIKIKRTAAKASEQMGSDIKSHMYSHEMYKDIPDSNRKLVDIKSLIHLFTFYSLCLARLKRWPYAKDKNSMPNIQKDFEKECLNYNKALLKVVCDSLADKWWFYFSGVEFCKQEIIDVIDRSIISSEEIEKISDIKLSPLFSETYKNFPNINLKTLESYYNMLSGKFIEAGIKALTLDFISNRPAELDYTDEFSEWSNIYIDHLHGYKEKWKNQLKEIETDTWNDQLKWRKESTSLPTANP